MFLLLDEVYTTILINLPKLSSIYLAAEHVYEKVNIDGFHLDFTTLTLVCLVFDTDTWPTANKSYVSQTNWTILV